MDGLIDMAIFFAITIAIAVFLVTIFYVGDWVMFAMFHHLPFPDWSVSVEGGE